MNGSECPTGSRVHDATAGGLGSLGGGCPGEVSELADEHDLGSCGAIRESSSLSFPTARNDKRKWLSGRASPCQGEGREFESRLPLSLVEYEAGVCSIDA